jgi:hypothetical protein
MSVWRVDHDLDYNVLRGGHTRAVVALYACSGGAGAVPGDLDYRIFSASQVRASSFIHDKQININICCQYERAQCVQVWTCVCERELSNARQAKCRNGRSVCMCADGAGGPGLPDLLGLAGAGVRVWT